MLGHFELFHSNRASHSIHHLRHFEFEKDSSCFATIAHSGVVVVLLIIMPVHFASKMDSSSDCFECSDFTTAYFGLKAV